MLLAESQVRAPAQEAGHPEGTRTMPAMLMEKPGPQVSVWMVAHCLVHVAVQFSTDSAKATFPHEVQPESPNR